MMKGEIWKSIDGYEGYYEVSNMGNVRSLSRTQSFMRFGAEVLRKMKGRVLSPGTNVQGYPVVILGKNGVKYTARVHKVVANAFVSGHRPGLVVDHKNDIKSDCRASNLHWFTSSQNNIKSRANRTGARRLFSASTIPLIEELLRRGMAFTDLAKELFVSPHSLRQVINKKPYKPPMTKTQAYKRAIEQTAEGKK